MLALQGPDLRFIFGLHGYALRRTALPFRFFVPGRRIASSRTGDARGGARLPGARAHGSQRALRLHGVRPRGKTGQSPADHGRRSHPPGVLSGLRGARARASCHAFGRNTSGLRKPVPLAHRDSHGLRARRCAAAPALSARALGGADSVDRVREEPRGGRARFIGHRSRTDDPAAGRCIRAWQRIRGAARQCRERRYGP